MAATVADAPYAVVSFPLRLFSRGVRGGFLYLDESGVIYTLSQLLAPRELPWGFAFSATAGGLTGWGGGVTFVHDRFLGEANRFRLGAKTSETGHHKAHLGLYLPHGLHEVEVGVGYRANPNARYFGIGFGSRPEDRSYFKQELTWGGLSYERHLGWDTFLKPEVLYTQVHALPSPRDEDSPNIETHFSGAIPAGFQDRSDGVTWSISLGRDTTRETGRPVGGGVERVKVDYYHDVDEGDHRHWTYRVEVQRFVPLGFHDLRVLALRAYYTRIEAVGDDPVPFQRLMTNDDPDLLRGFRDYRFRDEGMVAFTAEYRWPVWADRHARHAGVDAYLFTDLGQVFSEPDDIALDHLSESYGVGARLVLPSGFVGRLEWGHSIEDDVVRLRVDQVFQFQRSSLFHGRNPIPTR
jgi:outer membrane protein assembly factor BamA